MDSIEKRNSSKECAFWNYLPFFKLEEVFPLNEYLLHIRETKLLVKSLLNVDQ